MARETFKKYKDAGCTMMEVDADDEQVGRMNEFNPDAHGVLAIPQLRGG